MRRFNYPLSSSKILQIKHLQILNESGLYLQVKTQNLNTKLKNDNFGFFTGLKKVQHCHTSCQWRCWMSCHVSNRLLRCFQRIQAQSDLSIEHIVSRRRIGSVACLIRSSTDVSVISQSDNSFSWESFLL